MADVWPAAAEPPALSGPGFLGPCLGGRGSSPAGGGGVGNASGAAAASSGSALTAELRRELDQLLTETRHQAVLETLEAWRSDPEKPPEGVRALQRMAQLGPAPQSFDWPELDYPATLAEVCGVAQPPSLPRPGQAPPSDAGLGAIQGHATQRTPPHAAPAATSGGGYAASGRLATYAGPTASATSATLSGQRRRGEPQDHQLPLQQSAASFNAPLGGVANVAPTLPQRLQEPVASTPPGSSLLPTAAALRDGSSDPFAAAVLQAGTRGPPAAATSLRGSLR
eukprot:TRINITY_DN1673_c1_g1_i1.p1 TRINITY_DN1673_c1_g1~~TRINITY_DN1673_c1_g1_i1.p1  ORF type:complete len:282 (+),score=46.51 TRINITY_DN1673_c1_g1_i1:139-984(+)